MRAGALSKRIDDAARECARQYTPRNHHHITMISAIYKCIVAHASERQYMCMLCVCVSSALDIFNKLDGW